MIGHPCAKINLGLNIVSKRNDGYHNLETVFYPINLTDEISIETKHDGLKQAHPCELTLNGIAIEGNVQDNLIVKAYNLLKERHANLPEITVSLTKNIPSQAGMGGGSSDCAYTITMLNKMFNLNLSTTDMQRLAAKLGADCPFFISPTPSFATGIGEELSPVSVDLSGYSLAIVKPQVMVSTKEAFARIMPKQPKKCCRDIVLQPIETWRDELVNDFELSVATLHPEIARIKQTLYDRGAVYAAMSGSGSAVFGVFKERPNGINETFNRCFTAIV